MKTDVVRVILDTNVWKALAESESKAALENWSTSRGWKTCTPPACSVAAGPCNPQDRPPLLAISAVSRRHATGRFCGQRDVADPAGAYPLGLGNDLRSLHDGFRAEPLPVRRRQGDWADFTRFWLIDVDKERMPRNWIRWAVGMTQVMGKVKQNDLRDGRLAAYLVDCDAFLTEDKKLAHVLDTVRPSCPVAMAETRRIKFADDPEAIVDIIDA